MHALGMRERTLTMLIRSRIFICKCCTWKRGNLPMQHNDNVATWQRGNVATWQRGNIEPWEHENARTGRPRLVLYHPEDAIITYDPVRAIFQPLR
jgi:hypothetical protein